MKLEIKDIRYYSKQFKWQKGWFHKPYLPYEWGAFSKTRNLTHEILTEFSDKLDWETLSENEHLPWSIDMVFQFKELWHWNLLLKNITFWDKIIEPL